MLRLPPVDQFRRLPSQVSLHRTLRRADGGELEMSVPFFWFNPEWHRYAVERCQLVEQAVTRQGVLTSALHRDLSQDDAQPVGNTKKRLVPHRPDRAGLIHRDLVEAAVIELRLLAMPNRFGGFTYESTQWSRWKNVEQLAHPIAASAMTFPPEWHSLVDVSRKVEQLRMLSRAAIVLSLDLQHADTILPQLVNAGLDGVMIRTGGDPLAAIQHTTELCRIHGLSLWIWLIAEQSLSPEDCIKCLAFGASGIAIDPFVIVFWLKARRLVYRHRISRRFAWGMHLKTVLQNASVKQRNLRLVNKSLAHMDCYKRVAQVRLINSHKLICRHFINSRIR